MPGVSVWNSRKRSRLEIGLGVVHESVVIKITYYHLKSLRNIGKIIEGKCVE